jgi:hypothetical protein
LYQPPLRLRDSSDHRPPGRRPIEGVELAASFQADQPALESLEEQDEIGVVDGIGRGDQVWPVHAVGVVLVQLG